VTIHCSAGTRRPDPHSAQRLRAPCCDCRRALASPLKSGNSSPLDEGRKEVIGTPTRILQGVTYPTYPSLRNTTELQEEKELKIPTTGAQEIKTLTKNNSRCVNLNTE
jgi:hypothetical protein